MRKISQPTGTLGKILQLCLTVGLVILGFIFSFVAFGLLLALGIAVWLWFWWKRYQLKKQFSAPQPTRSKTNSYSPDFQSHTQEHSGVILEGEVLSRDDQQGQLPPKSP